MHGTVIHDESVPFAGQKKATRGHEGASRFVTGSWITVPLELLAEAKMSAFLFLRGRWEAGGAISELREGVGYRGIVCIIALTVRQFCRAVVIGDCIVPAPLDSWLEEKPTAKPPGFFEKPTLASSFGLPHKFLVSRLILQSLFPRPLTRKQRVVATVAKDHRRHHYLTAIKKGNHINRFVGFLLFHFAFLRRRDRAFRTFECSVGVAFLIRLLHRRRTPVGRGRGRGHAHTVAATVSALVGTHSP
ncbi:hypothetical protein AC579_6248 [Pseudocercospora musae]|uniref:Uncharacterized protein n=1 Tax=Pseudocercospora musae TaxID=113226 RepID=A0A139IMM4_9PEZI|nr:hypothetical protein AC579_6248 [Pseudocercospora musae]